MKKLPLIIVLMSMALIGIIAMQSYWISKAVGFKAEEFDKSVNKAMVQTVLQLERDEAIEFLGHGMGSKSNAGKGSSLGSIHSKTYNFNVDIDSLQAVSSAPKIQVQREYIGATSTVEDLTLEGSLDKVYQWQNGDTAMVIIEASGDYESIKERILSKSGHFYTMVDEFLNEIATQDKSVENRVDSMELKRILAEELGRFGVEIPYHYGLIEGDSQITAIHSKGFQTECFKGGYQMALFPNALLTTPSYLQLYFPGKPKFFIRQLSLLIGLSLLFTFIILYIFTSSILIILRQKKLSEIKTDFIDNMTHEFKTPIATVSLATDALMNEKVYADFNKLSHYVKIIKQENHRMHSHVERVLQISLLDRQEVTMHVDTVNIKGLITDVVENMQLQVKDRTGRLDFDCSIKELQIDVDVMHISNVLSNLIDNAIKYSEDSPIISVSLKQDKEWVIISVSDKGMGMDQETQKHVFEKFYRKPTGNIHNIKGFGLGLSYVKAVIEAHQGRITLQSELKKGSTFSLRLPIKKG
jgi:two-component system phosphate regulon sensor histidine kinase PhoR